MPRFSPLPRDCRRWLVQVDRILRREWRIDSEDAGWDREDVLRYWGYGETPEEFVEGFAEKYDLIRFEPYGTLNRRGRATFPARASQPPRSAASGGTGGASARPRKA